MDTVVANRLGALLFLSTPLLILYIARGITAAAPPSTIRVECSGTSRAHRSEGESSTATRKASAKHVEHVVLTTTALTTHSTSHRCTENVGKLRRQSSARKHFPEYVVRVHMLEWVLSGTLRPAEELLLRATLIVLALLILVAKSHVRLRQSLERLLRLRCLILIRMHLQRLLLVRLLYFGLARILRQSKNLVVIFASKHFLTNPHAFVIRHCFKNIIQKVLCTVYIY